MLKLSDIADVRRGYEDPPTYLIRHQGEPAILLGVVMQEGWSAPMRPNVVLWLCVTSVAGPHGGAQLYER
jgi:hypothetical protein